MDRVIATACILVLALIVLETFGVTAATSVSAAQSKAGWIATQYVKGDETYKYDGVTGSLKVLPAQGAVSIMGYGAPSAYTFKASFSCKHAGYGNRAGRILAQAVTRHTALITVKNNKVISATMDGKWNMLTEKPL